MVGFTCPCGRRYMANDWLAGRAYQCPRCRRYSTFPSPAWLESDAPTPDAASRHDAGTRQEPPR